MGCTSKVLEQTNFTTRLQIRETILIAMDKPTDEEEISHSLQTQIKQFKIVVNFFWI